jgi:hypothetical protein
MQQQQWQDEGGGCKYYRRVDLGTLLCKLEVIQDYTQYLYCCLLLRLVLLVLVLSCNSDQHDRLQFFTKQKAVRCDVDLKASVATGSPFRCSVLCRKEEHSGDVGMVKVATAAALLQLVGFSLMGFWQLCLSASEGLPNIDVS